MVLLATLLLSAGGMVAAPVPGQAKLAGLPPAVQQTIRTQVGNGRIEDVTRTNENGQVVYEVEIRKGGLERSLTVAVTGKLIALQMFLGELPTVVQQTIRAQIGGSQLLDIFWTDEDGEISYEIEYQKGPLKREMSVAPDGRLLSLQVELAETPAAVQKTINTQAAGGKVGEIYRVEEDGEQLFAAEVTRDGRKRSFAVALDGKFLSEGIELPDAPAPVQKTIKTELGSGRVTEIDRFDEGGETFFDVKVSRDGRRHSFIVASDGALVGVRVQLSETPGPVQKAIKERLAGATLVRVDKATEDGATIYEVEARKDGKRFSFSVGTDGTVGK